MAGPMTEDEVRAYLDGAHGWLALATNGPRGYPHCVPVGYYHDGDAVYISCRAGSQKTKNVERDGRATLMLESGSEMADLKGIVLEGEAEVVTDPERCLEWRRRLLRNLGRSEDDLPAEHDPGSAFIVVRPLRTVSWDYAKQG